MKRSSHKRRRVLQPPLLIPEDKYAADKRAAFVKSQHEMNMSMQQKPGARFTVREVPGPGSAVMFQVRDGYTGELCGTPHYLRDDADAIAAGLEWRHRNGHKI